MANFYNTVYRGMIEYSRNNGNDLIKWMQNLAFASLQLQFKKKMLLLAIAAKIQSKEKTMNTMANFCYISYRGMIQHLRNNGNDMINWIQAIAAKVQLREKTMKTMANFCCIVYRGMIEYLRNNGNHLIN